jgi:dihydrofolate synthase/folylpolyglutamate synthase
VSGSADRVRRAEEAELAKQRLRAVYSELLARTPEDRMQPRLGPVRRVCELLGEPQRAYPVIHLTGTNGKTSTARMIERLLREHNLRTGRFTSPHLQDVTERISVDGRPLSAAKFVEVYEDVAPYVAMVDGELRQADQVPITYFEMLAVMAFAAFADAPVDVAVVEVGLGGTWDATNVADATVAVITPISLDHTRMLGDTVAEIAGEKAGIITEGGFVVMAQQPVEAAEVLLAKAVEGRATVAREGMEFGVTSRQVAVGGQVVTVQGLAGTYTDVFLPLHGEHQAHNMAVAIAAVEAFIGNGDQPLSADVVQEAMADMTSPGRLELVRQSPAVIVDAAHNPAGAQALVAAMEEAFNFTYLVGVVGVLADKDAGAILDVLEPLLDEVVITRSTSPRAVPVGVLAEEAEDVFGEDRVHVEERLDDAIVAAADRAEAEGGQTGGVLVTGSVTVAGEARVLLRAPAVDEQERFVQREERL